MNWISGNIKCLIWWERSFVRFQTILLFILVSYCPVVVLDLPYSWLQSFSYILLDVYLIRVAQWCWPFLKNPPKGPRSTISTLLATSQNVGVKSDANSAWIINDPPRWLVSFLMTKLSRSLNRITFQTRIDGLFAQILPLNFTVTAKPRAQMASLREQRCL